MEFAFSVILSLPLIVPGLLDLHRLHDDRGASRDHHLAIDHDRIVDQRTEGRAGLRRVHINRFGEPDIDHRVCRHGDRRRRARGRGRLGRRAAACVP